MEYNAFIAHEALVDIVGQDLGKDTKAYLATSYAIFEVLDRLGCRWFMPSELGEVCGRRNGKSFNRTWCHSSPPSPTRGRIR